MGTVVYGKKIKLRDKELGDARQDYEWQLDWELARLDASPMTQSSFREYTADYAVQLRSPNHARHIFAVVTLNGRHIGNCSYYNLNETRREAELGIMIGDRAFWDKGYGTDAVNALLKYVFTETDLLQLHLKSLDWNLRAHRCFEGCGFTGCGYLYRDGYSFILMEIRREKWQELCPERVASPAAENGGGTGERA